MKEVISMDKTMIKKIQIGFISLSALTVLAACGNGGTGEEPPAQEDPATEEPAPAPEEETGQDDTSGQDDTGSQSDTSGNQDQAATDTSNGINNVEFPVTMDDAVQTFHDEFGEDVTIDQIDFDEDDGNYEYNVQGWNQENEYDLDINADTGEIQERDTESDNDDDDQEDTLELENILTPQEAMDIAVQEAGSEIVEEWSLDTDNGLTVYEVNLENADDDDITIDAATGDVVDR